MTLHNRIFWVALMASTAFGASAHAQEAPEGVSAVDEIVVTARKRDETLQDVPLTITAFSEREIESKGLNSLADISSFSPGLLYTEQGSQRGGRSESVIRFRGMDTNDITPSRALASAFVDGVYVAGGLSSIALDEVARVEVIKGPQSAYFGRTTFGGAINFVTRPISEDFETRAAFSAAEGNEYDVSGSVEGALVADVLSARISARYYSAGGRYKSIADGGRLGAEETKSVSLSLSLRPSSTLDIRVRGFYAEDDDGPATTFTLTNMYHNCGPFPGGVTTYICGTIPVVKEFGTNTVIDPVPYDILVNNSRNSPALAAGPKLDHMGLRRNSLRGSIAADWEMPIENTTLSFVAGYGKIEQRRLMDLDYTPSKVWLESHFQDIEDTSLELRLSNEQPRFRWMLGLSYFTMKFSTPSGASISYAYPSQFNPGHYFGNQSITTDDIKTSAIFGSGTYDLTDTVNFSFEARYQSDKLKKGVANSASVNETFSAFLPRAILQWTPSNSTNLYLTYAEGNKPGDFNSNLITLTPAQLAQAQASTGASIAVGEEDLVNYEFGWKQSLFDRRVSLNIATYYMIWKNQQTRTTAAVSDPTVPSGFRSIPVVISAGKTALWGLEFEGSWAVTPSFTLSGTFNYAASEYKQFLCGFCRNVTGTTDMSGNESPRFPKYSGSISADYRNRLTNDFDWFARVDAIYTGSAWDEAFNLAKTADFWRANIRVGIEDERWRGEIFVKNLFDDRNYLSAARFTDFARGDFSLTHFTTNVSPADPRQIGMRVSVKL